MPKCPQKISGLDSFDSTLAGLNSFTGTIREWTFDVLTLKKIMVVGASGAGKTTLVNAVRDLEGMHIPKRYITRPRRKNDDLTENTFVSRSEFDDLVKAGEIQVHWLRRMEKNRIEKYGFEKTDPTKLALFSGNNAILEYAQMTHPVFDKDTLWIGVSADENTRKKRLKNRSPDLGAEELAIRLNKSNEYDIEGGKTHLIISNGVPIEKRAVQDFRTFIQRILALQN